TLILVEQRYPIAFEPVRTNPRLGRSTVRLHDGFAAVISLLRTIMLFAPVRIFMPIGLFMVAVGSVYSIVLGIFSGRGLPVGGALLIITGLLCVMLGLIADQISQLRLSHLPEISFISSEDSPTSVNDLR